MASIHLLCFFFLPFHYALAVLPLQHSLKHLHQATISSSGDVVNVRTTARISHHERARATARVSAVAYREGLVGQMAGAHIIGDVVQAFAGDATQYMEDLEREGWRMTKGWTMSTEGGNGQDSAEIWKNHFSGECILGFRGSDDVTDLARDVSTSPTSYQGLTGVSSGIVQEFDPLLKHMKEDRLVNKLSECDTLTVTGHSLGGALAVLFSALANKNGDPLSLGVTVDYLLTYGAMPVSQTPLQNDKSSSGCFEGARYYNMKKFCVFLLCVKRSDFAVWVGACWHSGCLSSPPTGPMKHPKLRGVELYQRNSWSRAQHLTSTCESASSRPTNEREPKPFDPRSVLLHMPKEYVDNIGDAAAG